MDAKAEVLKLLQDLPDDCSADDILAELFFRKQVDEGLRDVAEGQTITHEELKRRIVQWRRTCSRFAAHPARR